jgi:hypothetical protein
VGVVVFSKYRTLDRGAHAPNGQGHLCDGQQRKEVGGLISVAMLTNKTPQPLTYVGMLIYNKCLDSSAKTRVEQRISYLAIWLDGNLTETGANRII